MSVPSEEQILQWFKELQESAIDDAAGDAIGWDKIDRNPEVFENALEMIMAEIAKIETAYMRLVRGELTKDELMLFEEWLADELQMLYRLKALRDRYKAVKDITENL